MSNSKKIVIVVVGICLLSLWATLNLIKESRETRAGETASSGTETQPEQTSNASADKSGIVATPDIKEQPSTASSGQAEVTATPEGATGDSKAQGEQQAPGVIASQKSEKKSSDASSEGGVVQNSAAATVISEPEKKKIKFPGIEQHQGRIMVRDIRHKMGEGEDQVSVTLTVTDGGSEASGRVWIIGEYVQRGTTGVMYMPSHQDLNLSADGKPQNPAVGQTFSMRSNTEKTFLIKRPGFEGEELTAIRVGVWDKNINKLHVARMPIKNGSRKSNQQRAKVEVQ